MLLAGRRPRWRSGATRIRTFERFKALSTAGQRRCREVREDLAPERPGTLRSPAPSRLPRLGTAGRTEWAATSTLTSTPSRSSPPSANARVYSNKTNEWRIKIKNSVSREVRIASSSRRMLCPYPARPALTWWAVARICREGEAS